MMQILLSLSQFLSRCDCVSPVEASGMVRAIKSVLRTPRRPPVMDIISSTGRSGG